MATHSILPGGALSSGAQSQNETEVLTTVWTTLVYCAEKHHGHFWKRRTDTPFLYHLIDVFDLLWNPGQIRDVEVLTAALLHDVLEKSDTLPPEIQQKFGSRICKIVLELTDDENITRRERYRRQVEHAASLSLEARIIKIADKASNVRNLVKNAPEHWSRDKLSDYVQAAREVVDQIRGIHSELEAEFDRAYHDCLCQLNL